MARVLITGGAGCIGSDLAAALAARGYDVVVFDDFSSGTREHLAGVACTVIEGDVQDRGALVRAAEGATFLWHLAASPDVRCAAGQDVEHHVLGTENVLEAVRAQGIGGIAFTSTSAVYGISKVQPIPESAPLRPISVYAAAKASAEALVLDHSLLHGVRCWVFRLANIVGAKARTRGATVIPELIQKLRATPRRLEILGDGRQAKSYLTVAECIEAMLTAVECAREPRNVFNVGGPDRITVDRIAELIVEAMGLRGVEFIHTGGAGGWPGDVPSFVLDARALGRLGWRARLNSEESVRAAIAGMLGTT